MALGFGEKKTTSDSSNLSSSYPTEKDNDLSDQAIAENGGHHSRKGEKPMNRIDRPLTKSITGDSAMGDSSTDVSVSIGKQMELEADNAIKYRTCSWQKVCHLVFPLSPPLNGQINRDRLRPASLKSVSLHLSTERPYLASIWCRPLVCLV